MFFEKRVYQGSSGKVYPIPFIDKVQDRPKSVTYRAAFLENDYLRLMMLPEIGGRIHVAQDKSNNDYDFFYRQDVIKPALVGLVGPWISGGVEFNWPQHHRPGTFMPTDVELEREADGACTVWMSEHDPMKRLKGMHGVRIRPGSSLIELRVRLFNRTTMTQTFLWWANVAARVHDQYQSFFPPDVRYVADHAKRSMSSFPIAENAYYGISYAQRPGANDLTWYKNILVPTSYMIVQTRYDFFGGYDYQAKGGFVHVANRHISPGKKQWTWGNHAFGWAWDRELSDDAGPYVELMAGVYTDNQPDFTYLYPYETKTFSQYWWPIQQIGPVQCANTRAAIRLHVQPDRRIQAAVAVSAPLRSARLTLLENCQRLLDLTIDVEPGKPWQNDECLLRGEDPAALRLAVQNHQGKAVLNYRPEPNRVKVRIPPPAKAPPLPAEVATNEGLFLIGEHLEQYRHPTRDPEAYWAEALRRDAYDARSRTALGRRCLERAQFAEAIEHFEYANARLTERHPNPITGEAFYYAGVTRQFLGDDEKAYEAFYKATWDYAWRSPAYYWLALLDCRAGRFEEALNHLDLVLITNQDHNHAVIVRALIHRQKGEADVAQRELSRLLAHDPLDQWARYEMARWSGEFDRFIEGCRNDAQIILDLVFDYVDGGFYTEALDLLALHDRTPVAATATPNPRASVPALTRFVAAWLWERLGYEEGSRKALAEAQQSSPEYLFPSRIREQIVLEWALKQNGSARNAGYALGNFLFDAKRHEDAIVAWEKARTADSPFPIVLRNLGIAYWNVRKDGQAAREMYKEAFAFDPTDARILFEYDQLRKKLNDPPAERLEFLLARTDLVAQRDDLATEVAVLFNLLDRPEEALQLMEGRRFHPWEGGEGQVLRQYTASRIRLGRKALRNDLADQALMHFEGAYDPPRTLGEAYHYLQAKADVNYWKGRAYRALHEPEKARTHFELSAGETGDFLEMSVTAYSPLTFYRGLSLTELGHPEQAKALFEGLATYARNMKTESASIDYFATSLPLILVFDEDLQARKQAEAAFLLGLAQRGLGDLDSAIASFEQVLHLNRSHPGASEQLQDLREGSGSPSKSEAAR
ncbi:MAG: DUF5107 domain-containing protein [Verrucomicrobia bacterium]|nr:DUF5107 domain-containing protein [Verrucomicrobiota bacterium]